MKLTNQQKDTLLLIQRSKDIGSGWVKCPPGIFEYLIKPMPISLVDRNNEVCHARLTNEALILLKWL